ncbi:MAG TPA: hypothetical protein VGM39_17735, partial [Kofleriaceae bacterium]
MSVHRFLPRYRGLAWGAIGVGGGLTVVGAVVSASLLGIFAPAFGLVLGAFYLKSPTWKLAIV